MPLQPVHQDEIDPHNAAQMAEAVLRMQGVIQEAESIMLAFGESVGSPKHKRYFARMALCLGDFQNATRPMVMGAQKTLGITSPLAGLSGQGADGSSVRIDGEGLVQHSAPDSVLESLGLKKAGGSK